MLYLQEFPALVPLIKSSPKTPTPWTLTTFSCNLPEKNFNFQLLPEAGNILGKRKCKKCKKMRHSKLSKKSRQILEGRLYCLRTGHQSCSSLYGWLEKAFGNSPFCLHPTYNFTILMFITTLLVISPNLESPYMPMTDNWIKNLWNTFNGILLWHLFLFMIYLFEYYLNNNFW